MLPPNRLDDSGHGRRRVITKTTTRYLNLRRAVTRVDGAGWSVSAHRCDCEFVESIKRARCEAGAEMQLLLRIRDGRVTVRLTTETVVINPE